VSGSSAFTGVVYVPRKSWSVCAGVYALFVDGGIATAGCQ
jgi:roadblock/LC7 domain-containing protein